MRNDPACGADDVSGSPLTHQGMIMEQRRVYGKSHWYHETQASSCPPEILPLVPEAANVEDRFLLELTLPAELVAACEPWLACARQFYDHLFPNDVDVTRLQTFSAYDRLSTALTVAQASGVQRLCNHYAARLAPLPGPDSSRESNRRLAQITQYARQLASSPSVISSLSRQQLDEVGLTTHDIVLFNQIVGFVGFQARVIAVFQAVLGLPVRWLPGMPALDDADPALFSDPRSLWQADLPTVDPLLASEAQRQALATWQSEPVLRDIAAVLAQDARLLEAFGDLLIQLPADGEHTALAALLSARINGSVACFNTLAAEWRSPAGLPDAARNGERALQVWSHNAPVLRAIIQAVQVLTRTPDRFSAAQLTQSGKQHLSTRQAINLLTRCAFDGWLNRLKIAFGSALPLAP